MQKDLIFCRHAKKKKKERRNKIPVRRKPGICREFAVKENTESCKSMGSSYAFFLCCDSFMMLELFDLSGIVVRKA